MDIIISHKADLDGIASAALLARHEIRENLPFLIFLKDYEDEENLIDSSLLNISDNRIMIVDVSGEQRKFGKILERIKALKHSTINWIDHHPISEANRRTLTSINVKMDVDPTAPAAASMVYDRFYKLGEDPVADRLLKYAIQADTWTLTDDEAKRLVELVAYYNYLDRTSFIRPHLIGLVYYLASTGTEQFIGEEYIVQLNLYQKMQALAISALKKSVRRRKIGGYNIIFALSPDQLSGTIAADTIIRGYRADIVIVIKESGAISFRRTRDDVDLASLASLFGGGGHDYAAGAKTDYNSVDLEKYEMILEHMSETMKKMLTSQSKKGFKATSEGI